MSYRRRIDLLDGDLYGDHARTTYAWMRRSAPVHYDEHNHLWGVARYGDVLTVGGDPQTFSSAGGSRPDTGPMPWMIDMDAPDHLERRKLVNRGFTPRRVRPGSAAECDRRDAGAVQPHPARFEPGAAAGVDRP